MQRVTKRLAIYLGALLVCLVFAAVTEACPTCKNSSLPGSGNAGNLVDGYGWSIIFMMSMPFLILFSLASYFYYEVRKARRQQAAAGFVDPRMPMDAV